MKTPAQRGRAVPEVVRVTLLGTFRLSVGSRTVQVDAFRLRKAANLVKLLALAPGCRLHRERALDLLWPDLGRRAAANNLRQALHVARRIFDPDAEAGTLYLDSQGEVLALCPEGPLLVDVDAFEEAAMAARRSRDPAAYRSALELYSGDLLPEDRYEEWAESRRQELKGEFLSLLVELANLYEARGEYGHAIETLKRTLKEESASEEAHAGLMRLYALSRRRGDALKQYERLRVTLAETLGTEPGASTRRLLEAIAAGETPSQIASDPPPSVEPEAERQGAGKHNLPASRTSFVGRERDLVEIKRELVMTRLLTLTGTGGMGKTRLALELARELAPTYRDGAWMVELADLSEPELVPSEVAEAVGVQERPDRTLLDALAGALRDKEMLLVLDNCEHLIRACAGFSEIILDLCPGLRILATSREPLDAAVETSRVLSPLSVPDPRQERSVDDVAANPSARLFVERAAPQPRLCAGTAERRVRGGDLQEARGNPAGHRARRRAHGRYDGGADRKQDGPRHEASHGRQRAHGPSPPNPQGDHSLELQTPGRARA